MAPSLVGSRSTPRMAVRGLPVSGRREILWARQHNTSAPACCSGDYPQGRQRIVKDTEQVPLQYPELICIEKYPPATPYFSAPFRLATPA